MSPERTTRPRPVPRDAISPGEFDAFVKRHTEACHEKGERAEKNHMGTDPFWSLVRERTLVVGDVIRVEHEWYEITANGTFLDVRRADGIELDPDKVLSEKEAPYGWNVEGL